MRRAWREGTWADKVARELVIGLGLMGLSCGDSSSNPAIDAATGDVAVVVGPGGQSADGRLGDVPAATADLGNPAETRDAPSPQSDARLLVDGMAIDASGAQPDAPLPSTDAPRDTPDLQADGGGNSRDGGGGAGGAGGGRGGAGGAGTGGGGGASTSIAGNSGGTSTVEGGSALTFYAVYDRIVDADQISTSIDRVTISADGKRIFFANADNRPGTRKGFAIDPDGTGLTTYNLPDPSAYGSGSINRVVTSETGARTYFVPPYDKKVFKLENGTITSLTVDKVDGPADVAELGISADGGTLVFHDLWRIWTMDHTGAGLAVLVKADEIAAADGKGESLGNMAVAADGTTIAFVLYVRSKTSGGLSTEIFSLRGGKLAQLTDDRKGVASKGTGILISGDGSTIVYLDAAQRKYISVAPDGSNARAVAPIGINATVSWSLTFDGKKMIYAEPPGILGRIINTDGTGPLDLFPHLYIAMTGPLAIAKDGSHMVFDYDYTEAPNKRCLYVGHLNDVDAVATAPKIHGISFNPTSMPRGKTDATIVLAASISDPDGLADIKSTTADELLDGVLKNGPDVPAEFYFAPLDDGAAPDTTAGDGIFSTIGRPGGKINDLGEMTIRVGAKDSTNTVVLADTVLTIGP